MPSVTELFVAAIAAGRSGDPTLSATAAAQVVITDAQAAYPAPESTVNDALAQDLAPEEEE